MKIQKIDDDFDKKIWDLNTNLENIKFDGYFFNFYELQTIQQYKINQNEISFKWFDLTNFDKTNIFKIKFIDKFQFQFNYNFNKKNLKTFNKIKSEIDYFKNKYMCAVYSIDNQFKCIFDFSKKDFFFFKKTMFNKDDLKLFKIKLNKNNKNTLNHIFKNHFNFIYQKIELIKNDLIFFNKYNNIFDNNNLKESIEKLNKTQFDLNFEKIYWYPVFNFSNSFTGFNTNGQIRRCKLISILKIKENVISNLYIKDLDDNSEKSINNIFETKEDANLFLDYYSSEICLKQSYYFKELKNILKKYQLKYDILKNKLNILKTDKNYIYSNDFIYKN